MRLHLFETLTLVPPRLRPRLMFDPRLHGGSGSAASGAVIDSPVEEEEEEAMRAEVARLRERRSELDAMVRQAEKDLEACEARRMEKEERPSTPESEQAAAMEVGAAGATPSSSKRRRPTPDAEATRAAEARRGAAVARRRQSAPGFWSKHWAVPKPTWSYYYKHR